MKCLKLTVPLILGFLLIASSACSAAPPAEKAATGNTDTSNVRIVVTQNYGQELIFDQTIEIKDRSNALETLKQVAHVDTSYGGGFVSGINGIRSKYTGFGSTPEDWFVYINGMISNTGAADADLHSGDIEHWDYHNWSFQPLIPAIIGDFPEPFWHGYGGKTSPTVITYATGLKNDADNLESRLTGLGVKAVSSKKLDELLENEKESANLILMGTPENGLVSELNQEWKRLGFFAYFENGSLVTVKADGKIDVKYGAGTGLIQATQNPWNPNGVGADENVVWLISGTDAAGVEAAVDILLNHSDEFKYTHSVASADGKVIKLPQ